MLIYYLCLLICFGTSTIQGVVVYVARHVINDSNQTLVLILLTVCPAFVVAAFIPKITKKIDKFKLFLIFNIGTVVTSVLTFFVGFDSLPLLYISCFVRGTFFGGISLMAYTFTADLVEYGDFVKHERAEGISFSFQTFIAKLISAVQSSLCIFLMGLFGFVSGTDSNGLPLPQSPQTVNGIWLLFTLIPCIGGVIGIVLFSLFYNLKDKDVQIMSKANHQEISREEALKLLSKEYL
jgi:GPH family glycoside/pentoside/hexuronide:cation symporter